MHFHGKRLIRAAAFLSLPACAALLSATHAPPVSGNNSAQDWGLRLAAPPSLDDAPSIVRNHNTASVPRLPLGLDRAEDFDQTRSEIHPDAFVSTDIIRRFDKNSLKERLVIKDRNAPARFEYLVDMTELFQETDAEGNLLFKQVEREERFNIESIQDSHIRATMTTDYSDGHPAKFKLQAPVMSDAKGHRSEPGDVKVEVLGSRLILTPSPEWLDGHAYPITVDSLVEVVEQEKEAIEFGDVGSDDFRPKMKLGKWGDESYVSLEYEVAEDATPVLDGNKVRLETRENVDVEMYPREPEQFVDAMGRDFLINENGGLELDLILKRRPKSNRFDYKLDSKGLDFYRQTEISDEDARKRLDWAARIRARAKPENLTPEEWQEALDRLPTTLLEAKRAMRPEHVLNSYAVYHQEKSGDYTRLGGKNYRTGKAFHIYRPKVYDANGNWIWGDLEIRAGESSGHTVLTVTVDQDFLDQAVYPVTVDPTFGYTSQGASNIGGNSYDQMWGFEASPSSGGFGDNVTVYLYPEYGDNQVKAALYDGDNIITNGETEEISTFSTGWVPFDFLSQPSISSSTTYTIAVWLNSDTSTVYYDSGAASGYDHCCSGDTTYGPVWPEPHGMSTNSFRFSFYVTYSFPPAMYYSVGTETSALYSGNASAVDGTVFLETAASDNIGVGDEIREGSNRYYITGRTSSTEFSIQNSAANGGTPGDTSINFGGVSFVDSGTAVTVDSGNMTSVGVPTGIQSNDILVVAVHQRDNVDSTMPGDWTPLVSGNGNSTNRLEIWWKRTSGSESAPTVTHTGGANGIAIMLAFRGAVTSGDPFDAVGTVQSNGGSPISTASISTSVDGATILHAFGSQDDNDWGNFTGIPVNQGGFAWRNPSGFNNDSSLGLTYGMQSSSGSTGAAGASQTTGGSDAGVSVQMALAPEPTSISIYRAFNSLSAAEANSSDSNHLDSTDLVTNNFQLNWPTYADDVMDDTVVIDGYTTDADRYIRIYTPVFPNEVGTSQRHSGVAGTGFQLAPSGSADAIHVSDNYTRIEGIVINGSSISGTHQNIESDASNMTFDALVLHDSQDNGILLGGSGTDRVSNVIVYDSPSEGIDVSSGTAYLYDSTFYNNGGTAGVYNSSGTVTVRNTASLNNGSADFGGTLTQSYNVSSDTSAVCASCVQDETDYSTYFVSISDGTEDFHLQTDSFTLWGSYGQDLSGDTDFSVTYDIDGQYRSVPVDIGADEVAPAVDVFVDTDGTQTATMTVGSTNQYVGGKFVISDITGSHTITGITIRESGTVDGLNDLDNIKLFYELDTTSPFDGASESFSGSEAQFGATDTDGFSAADGTSSFTDSVGIAAPSSALVVYVVFDVGLGASDGETVEISINDPSTDVTASSGTVGLSSPVAIAGTTTIQFVTTLTLANHDLGQVGDQFAATTPVTSELFGFKISRIGTVTVDNIRVHFTTTGGVVDGDVTSGELWRDANDNGIIDGPPDTSVQTGVSASGGFLNFTSLGEDPGVSGTNYLFRATVANLAPDDTTTFSVARVDIDEVESDVFETGSVLGAVHTQDNSSGGDVYYSVGTDGSNLMTGSPDMTISNGTATLTVAQTGDIGVGDEINYDSGSTAYIKKVISQTQFVLHTATGGVPSDETTAVTVDDIGRAFSSISNAESGSVNSSHLNNTDLTATGANANLHWVLYNDGTFTAGATISGYTTDATHYITLTVAGASQVASGNSQRHDGTEGTGVVVDPSSANHAFTVQEDYTRFEWLEVTGWTGNSNEGFRIAADNTVYSHLLVHGVTDPEADGFYLNTSGDLTATIRNTIVYDIPRACIHIQNVNANNDTYTLENVTTFNCGHGGSGTANPTNQAGGVVMCAPSGGSSTIVATNVLSLGNTDEDGDGDADFVINNGDSDCGGGTTTWSTSDFNISEDATAPGSNSLTGRDPALQFLSAADPVDLHLISGSDAIDAGDDLSGTFTNDIDDETRGGSWDVGADEHPTTTNYRSIGTASDYSTNTVTATNGSRTVTGDTTEWETENRGRGDRITIDGVDYTILSVDSETEITLTSPYSGTGGSGLSYNIARKFQTLQDWEDCISFAASLSTISAAAGGSGLGPYTVPTGGSNRLLLFATSYEDTDGTFPDMSVTFGGVPMTRAVSQYVQNGSSGARTAFFYLKEADIPSGNQSFIVTSDSPPREYHWFGTFYNVDQTSPVAGTEQAASVGEDTITTPSFQTVAGGWAAASAASGVSGNYSNGSWGSGWVEDADAAVGSFTAGGAGAAYGSSGTDIATAMFNSSANYQVLVAISLAPTGYCEGVYSADLLADDRAEVGIAYEDSDFTDMLLIDGSTTDATHDITLTADGDNRHYGLAGQGVVVDMGSGTVDGVRVQDDYVTVEWLEVKNGTGGADGIQVQSLSVSNSIAVRNNLVHDVTDIGISTADENVVIDIYNNIVYNTTGPGIRIANSTPLTAASEVRIMNNTVYNTGNNGIRTTNAGSTEITLQNNISHTTVGNAFRIGSTVSVNSDSSNNLASDSSGTTHSTTGGQNNVSDAEVKFVDTGSGTEDLHIQDGSFAQDAGADLSAVFSSDIDDGTRAALWDVGADDIEATTAVGLTSFEATALDGAVLLEWVTGSEVDNLGFHLYRSDTQDGTYQRITAGLIPGLGSSPEGASYSYVDSALVNGETYYYKLEDVETTGVTEMHGPVSATPEEGASGGEGEELPGKDEEGEEDDSEQSTGSRITYGKPWENEVTVRQLNRRTLEIELLTKGFYAYPEEDGSVRLAVPGLEFFAKPGEPAVPVYRGQVPAVVGRKVRVNRVRVDDVDIFTSLRPSATEAPEVISSPDGTTRAGKRKVRRKFLKGKGLYPESPARLVEIVFQEDEKKALVEMSPLRWDEDGARLLLAKRMTARVRFRGKEPSERELAGGKGRRHVETHEPREVLARFVTTEPGLYGVRFDEIFEKGTREIRTDELRLSHQGVPVAFRVTPRAKKFNRRSTLYFLSEGPDANPYGNEAVYELERSHAGVVMDKANAEPFGLPVLEYWRTVKREKNLLYQSAFVEAEDIWQWDWIGSWTPMSPCPPADPSAPLPRGCYGFQVENLTPSPSALTLEIWLQGGSDFPELDHHARVYVNGTLVTEEWWDGETGVHLTAEIGPGVLLEGENVLEVENVGDTDAAYSIVYLDRFEVTYPSQVVADDGKLEGSFDQSGTAWVSGLTNAYAFDITGEHPLWLDGVNHTQGVGFATLAGHEYLVVGEDAVRSAEVRKPFVTSLRSEVNAAEYIVIGPREFLSAAEPLLRYRLNEGLRTMAVAVEDIYSEFGYGEETAESVHEFLSYAYHHWNEPNLRYVLLLGDGTYDPKDYLVTGVENQVPVKLVKTQFVWTASDPWFAGVNGEDLVPDVAIGRLPAASVEELRSLVEKILAYETGEADPDAPVVLVTDNPDLAGDFDWNADVLAATVLSDQNVEKIYLSDLGTTAARSAILNAFDEGASVMSYIGHGGIEVWADESLLHRTSVDLLSPQSQQPLLFTMNCLNGYFHFPYRNSLAEELLKAEGKGIIAAFSPSGLSLDEPAHRFHRALLEEVVHGEHDRLGDAILAGQADYADSGAFPELLSIYHLLGDPALNLR